MSTDVPLIEKVRDSNGRFRTESLFYEFDTSLDKSVALYTLKDTDHKGLPSAKAKYLELEDPTEYEFAMWLVGNWKHWQRICANGKLKPHIEEWREELEVKVRAKAIKFLAQSDKGTDRKWIAEGRWLEKLERKENPRKRRIAEAISAEIEDDLARMAELDSERTH